MNIVDIDKLIETKAVIKFKGKEYFAEDPNIFQWLEFHSLDIEKELEKNTLATYLYLINIICPDLANETTKQKSYSYALGQILENEVKVVDTLSLDELAIVARTCITIFTKGSASLGKKIRPLEEITEKISPVAQMMKVSCSRDS